MFVPHLALLAISEPAELEYTCQLYVTNFKYATKFYAVLSPLPRDQVFSASSRFVALGNPRISSFSQTKTSGQFENKRPRAEVMEVIEA